MTRIRTAELLSIGTELTVGETRDTNAGDLARDLTRRGVVVGRMTALPDDLAAVAAAFGDALERADLVVSTGGLGPTPDDLTREAIAACLGEAPAVDPGLEAWLRELFDRRGLPFPETNRKQAWLIPSATAIPNDNGTAPGWWVDGGARRDTAGPGTAGPGTAGPGSAGRPAVGGLVVALPGPPREMRPMWEGWVLPRLQDLGLGRPLVSRTLRLTGIGESAIADRIGPLLAGTRPLVATYARADAVDIRIWTHADEGDAELRRAEELVEAAEARIVELLGDHVWARGEVGWPDTIRSLLEARGWRMSAIEVGLRGAFVALLGEGLGDRLGFDEVVVERPAREDGERATLEWLAARAGKMGGTEVGVAVEARPRGGDTAVTVAVVTPAGAHRETRVVFLDGGLGRARAAVAAAAILAGRLRR
jgi:nicotinamide-nucleotide amidase